MHVKIESRFGSPLAAIRETAGYVHLQFGVLASMFDADEAEAIGCALLDAAGEVRGKQLERVLPGSCEPARVVRAAA